VINEYKAILAKEKMRFVGKEEVSPHREREYRMIPSDRWQSVLGVKKFDKVAEFIGENLNFTKVEINLRQHIGAPSVPAVKTGDRVVKGDLIANANDGLSLPQHASIDGVVTVYDNLKIVIENK